MTITVGDENFTDGDMLDCYINIYSKHCYAGMIEYFFNRENGQELLDRWMYINMMMNWLLYVWWGVPHAILWFSFTRFRLEANPEEHIPKWEPAFYDDLTFNEWLWFKLCSLDTQMLIPLMASGLLGEEISAEAGGNQAIFIKRTLGFWTAENLSDQLAEHDKWEMYMGLFSLLIWAVIILVLVLVPYYLILSAYCTNKFGLEEVDMACQAAFWSHIEFGAFVYPKGGLYWDWAKDAQDVYDQHLIDYPPTVEEETTTTPAE